MIGSTTVRFGKQFTVAAVSLPDRQLEPEIGDGWVRFTQSAGGRTGFPAPRAVRRPPFVQYFAPIAWSTLGLTVHADGRSEGRLVGASPFPRHWVYDDRGALVAKSGLIDYKDWAGTAFGKHTPWGDEESPAFVTAVETALERKLSAVIMHGAGQAGDSQGQGGGDADRAGRPGGELFLLLDGVLVVEVDGSAVAEVGPGAVLGERAVLEGGARTSTLRARTACRVAAVPFDAVDRDQLLAAVCRPPSRGRRPARPDRNGQCACTCVACAARHPHQVRRSPASEGTRRASPLPIDAEPAPRLLLDGGTGLRRVAELLDGGPFEGALLLGHLHWDHTQGIPFFAAGDRPDARVDVHLPVADGDAAHGLDGLMAPPFFPIEASELDGRWSFQALDEGSLEVEEFTVLVREIPHTGGRTFGFRVSDGDGTIAYMSDHGPIALGPGPDGWGPYHEAVCELTDGVDVLLHDAQFTAAELADRPHFGHSAATTPSLWRSVATSIGCCSITTTPIAPTTRSMPSSSEYRGSAR